MEFSIVDCMLIIHDMDDLNKQLKLKLNITCDLDYNIKEEVKIPEIKIKVIIKEEEKM